MKGPGRQSGRLQLKQFVNQPPARAVEFDPEPETICFRGQTLSIIRHFFEISSQLGRLPSILGREFFRAKVSHSFIPSFEDQAVFIHDVETAIRQLSDQESEIVTLVGLYDLSHEEAAAILACSVGWVSQRYSEAIATLTSIFLEVGLLKRDRPDRKQVQLKGRPLPADVAGLPPKKACGSVRPAPADRLQRCAAVSIDARRSPRRP